MEEEVIVEELVKFFGPGFVSYLLRKFPDVQRLSEILNSRNLVEKMRQVDYIPKVVSENDIYKKKANELYPKLEHPATENLKSRLGSYDHKLMHVFNYKGEEIGHQITYPVNKRCVNRFHNKEYINGGQIRNRDIAARWNNAYGYYVAYLISYQTKNRALVMLSCKKLLSDFITESRRGDNVFILTKPSQNTETMVKDYSFTRIDNAADDTYCIHTIDRSSLLFSKKGLVR